MPKKKKNQKVQRANGMGTVYKLSGNRRRPWIARATVGWEMDKEGLKAKQLYQTLGYFETEEAANKALMEHQVNPIPLKANITLGELYEEWSNIKFKTIKKSTADNYRAAWNYLSRHAKILFRELRTAHFQIIINDLHQDSKSKSTMQKIKVLVGLLYSYAMENDIINKDYAEFITIPKTHKSEKEIFNDLEIQKLFNNTELPWVDTILIMIYSGMRISEMLGLTRFNVDLETGIMRAGVKTEAGIDRIIPIHPKIYPFIKKWYEKGGDYLICGENGNGINPDNYRKRYYFPCLEKLDIRRLTPHSCRHTFASMMAKAGANTKYIQEIIGHEDYALTANVYTHTEVKELKKAIEMI